MTRPNSCLVVDGSEIKLRLEADRVDSASPVHVDWLRFTVLLRNAAMVDQVDALWDLPVKLDSIWDEKYRMNQLISALRKLPDSEFAPSVQAAEFCREVCDALGPDFLPAAEPAKGHDFYRYRLPILRGGSEVGWIGFLSSGDSPRQSAQARTMHCNLYGHACTFAGPGWRDRMADLIDKRSGTLTRCDLALDYFDGLPRGMAGVVDDFDAGLCDVRGHRPKYNQLGRWGSDAGERSFYMGSKEGGKQTNVYEKGHQLFGAKSGNPWIRIELRYGNKLRVLPSEMLRRPGDFFAGASDWHESKLREFREVVSAEKITVKPRLQLETVDAEVSRLIRWAKSTAGPTISTLWTHAGESFLEFVFAGRRPGRVGHFKESDIAASFARLLPAGGVSPALA